MNEYSFIFAETFTGDANEGCRKGTTGEAEGNRIAGG